MIALLGALLYLSLCVAGGYAINASLGLVIAAVFVGILLIMLLTWNHWTTKIDYTEIIDSRPIYKRGHRYAGISIPWSGSSVSHFAYGRWQTGTEVRFRVHYLPGRKTKTRILRTTQGTWMYDRCILKRDEARTPCPEIEVVPVVHERYHGWALVGRIVAYLIAGAIALFATLCLIVGISEEISSLAWFSSTMAVLAVLVFIRLLRTRKQ